MRSTSRPTWSSSSLSTRVKRVMWRGSSHRPPRHTHQNQKTHLSIGTRRPMLISSSYFSSRFGVHRAQKQAWVTPLRTSNGLKATDTYMARSRPFSEEQSTTITRQTARDSRSPDLPRRSRPLLPHPHDGDDPHRVVAGRRAGGDDRPESNPDGRGCGLAAADGLAVFSPIRAMRMVDYQAEDEISA